MEIFKEVNESKQGTKKDLGLTSKNPKTWRQHNGYISGKGTAGLRENLKIVHSNKQNPTNKEKDKNLNQIKKANLLTDPVLALTQLRLWAKLDDAETLFSKIFLVTELLWLLWAFGVQTTNKRKNVLIPLIVDHLKTSVFPWNKIILMSLIFAILNK
ncbi:10920_t:CDS:2 [Entrophospora sp. SA101]|nr:10920_t:CDS:2 [Entrophospora sp. SA101]